MQCSGLVQTHSADSGLLKFWQVNFARVDFILDQALSVCHTQTVCQILYLCTRDNLNITKTKHTNKKSLELILYSGLWPSWQKCTKLSIFDMDPISALQYTDLIFTIVQTF